MGQGQSQVPMNLFACLRIVALLRRIARASERQAMALELLARVESDRWERENIRPKPRPTEFGHLDASEADKQWREFKREKEL